MTTVEALGIRGQDRARWVELPDSHGSRGFESQPWETLREELAEDISDDEGEKSSISEDGEDGSMIRDFMRGPEQSDLNVPEADVLENYCDSADLKSLQADAPLALEGAKKNFNIWWDDRMSLNGEEVFKNSRWITACQVNGESSKQASRPSSREGSGTDGLELPRPQTLSLREREMEAERASPQVGRTQARS